MCTENPAMSLSIRSITAIFRAFSAATAKSLIFYLIDVNEPVESFTGRIIGIAHRADDVEDKLIMAPPDMNFNREEVEHAVYFQEQYYDTYIELVK